MGRIKVKSVLGRFPLIANIKRLLLMSVMLQAMQYTLRRLPRPNPQPFHIQFSSYST
jgi:hypothetical protein